MNAVVALLLPALSFRWAFLPPLEKIKSRESRATITIINKTTKTQHLLYSTQFPKKFNNTPSKTIIRKE